MLNWVKQIMSTLIIKWEVVKFWSVFLRKGEGEDDGIITAWPEEIGNVCWLLR